MNLTIGSTTIAITNCVRRRDTKRGFYLDIEIPEEAISMDELKSLFKDNEQSITVTEAEGKTNVYYGFKLLSALSLEDGVYHVAQACTSEIEAQLSMAQNKVDEQNAVIEGQAAQVALLEEMSAVQISTIDSLLLEVLPAIIEESVTASVEKALEKNSATNQVEE